MAYSTTKPQFWIGSTRTRQPKRIVLDEQTQEAATTLRRAHENGLGAFFMGTQGTGKTTAMWSFAEELRALPFRSNRLQDWRWVDNPVLWTRVADYLDDVTYEFAAQKHAGYSAERFASSRARGVKYLFLDDLGAERETEFTAGEIVKLIDHRYETDGLFTFVTTNLNLDELGRRYSPRIPSRFFEMCEPLLFQGEDRRMQRFQVA